jgi:hypothetical protein
MLTLTVTERGLQGDSIVGRLLSVEPKKKPRRDAGAFRIPVREKSVPRGDRRATPEVKAVDQGGHDGLSEELVIVKVTGRSERRRIEKFRVIDPVILGEAILGLPGEARNPTALILDAAAKEPTLGRAALNPDTEASKASYWGDEVINAIQTGFSVAAGEVGEGVRIHEPADAAAYSPLLVYPLPPGKEVTTGSSDAITPHVGPIIISQEADHELTRAEEPAPRAEPELIVAAAAAAGQPASPAFVVLRRIKTDYTGDGVPEEAVPFVIEEAVTNTAGDVATGPVGNRGRRRRSRTSLDGHVGCGCLTHEHCVRGQCERQFLHVKFPNSSRRS